MVVQLKMEIDAPTDKVWAILLNAPAWPTWQKNIDSVAATGPLGNGTRFTWKTGGTTIHSQVQFYLRARSLSWTGTALTVKAIHVWELTPEPDNRTLVEVKESLDGPWIATLYPAAKLAASDTAWLAALKRAAEQGLKP